MPCKTGCLEANKIGSEKAAEEGFADTETAEDFGGREGDVHEEADWNVGAELGRRAEERGKQH